jgi:hypothetical protein
MSIRQWWQDRQDLKAEEASLEATLHHWASQGGYGRAAAEAQRKEDKNNWTTDEKDD